MKHAPQQQVALRTIVASYRLALPIPCDKRKRIAPRGLVSKELRTGWLRCHRLRSFQLLLLWSRFAAVSKS